MDADAPASGASSTASSTATSTATAADANSQEQQQQQQQQQALPWYFCHICLRTAQAKDAALACALCGSDFVEIAEPRNVPTVTAGLGNANSNSNNGGNAARNRGQATGAGRIGGGSFLETIGMLAALGALGGRGNADDDNEDRAQQQRNAGEDGVNIDVDVDVGIEDEDDDDDENEDGDEDENEDEDVDEEDEQDEEDNGNDNEEEQRSGHRRRRHQRQQQHQQQQQQQGARGQHVPVRNAAGVEPRDFMSQILNMMLQADNQGPRNPNAAGRTAQAVNAPRNNRSFVQVAVETPGGFFSTPQLNLEELLNPRTATDTMNNRTSASASTSTATNEPAQNNNTETSQSTNSDANAAASLAGTPAEGVTTDGNTSSTPAAVENLSSQPQASSNDAHSQNNRSTPGSRPRMINDMDLNMLLLALLHGQVPVRRAGGQRVNLADVLGAIENPFQMYGNPGDYVISEQAYQRVVNQIFEQSAGQHAHPPASEEEINKLPKRKVTESDVAAKMDCPVCREEFSLNDEVTYMPCKHAFHAQCIQMWLKQSGTCPMCRMAPVEKSVESTADPSTSNVAVD